MVSFRWGNQNLSLPESKDFIKSEMKDFIKNTDRNFVVRVKRAIRSTQGSEVNNTELKNQFKAIREEILAEPIKLYLKQTRQNDGFHHKGYTLMLITDQGLELYEPSHKTGSNPLPSVNFKQAYRIRQEIRNIKTDEFLLENFISICRKASFKVSYNADWIYRNVFAKKFADEIIKKIELRKFELKRLINS